MQQCHRVHPLVATGIEFNYLNVLVRTITKRLFFNKAAGTPGTTFTIAGSAFINKRQVFVGYNFRQ